MQPASRQMPPDRPTCPITQGRPPRVPTARQPRAAPPPGAPTRARRRLLAVALAAALCSAALPSAADGWDALRRPGAIALMRHALAPGTGDPSGFRLGECSTQRNLDARGRAQAHAAGDAIRAQGIEIHAVFTSRWCRARETAELLAVGPVEDLPALDSFFADRSRRDAQTAALAEILATLPPDQRVVLVTHQVNITALTGRVPRSGEIVVVHRLPDGGVEVAGSIVTDP